MMLPDPSLQRTIDRLTDSPACFALYRLPWTDEPVLVLQEGGEAEQPASLHALNGKTGFVLTPFAFGQGHPAVLIRPDRIANDWASISEVLAAYADGGNPHCPSSTPEAAGPAAPDEVTAKASYYLAFHRFIRPLQQRELLKLVLSRTAVHPLEEGFSPTAAFVRACNSYPRMMVSLCHTPATGTWMGSTPEIMLSGQGKQWSTVALAGTMPIQDDYEPGEWSRKNQEEQALVAEYIRRILKKKVSKVDEKGPYTARAGQLVHLKTDFRFALKHTEQLGDLLEELYPTPAVCGLPKQEAYEYILAHEGYDRRYYAGLIGWIDPQGDTHLYVNLRCMHLSGTTATLYAGGGIMPTSTAATEWEETKEKMKTMGKILGEPSR